MSGIRFVCQISEIKSGPWPSKNPLFSVCSEESDRSGRPHSTHTLRPGAAFGGYCSLLSGMAAVAVMDPLLSTTGNGRPPQLVPKKVRGRRGEEDGDDDKEQKKKQETEEEVVGLGGWGVV